MIKCLVIHSYVARTAADRGNTGNPQDKQGMRSLITNQPGEFMGAHQSGQELQRAAFGQRVVGEAGPQAKTQLAAKSKSISLPPPPPSFP